MSFFYILFLYHCALSFETLSSLISYDLNLSSPFSPFLTVYSSFFQDTLPPLAHSCRGNHGSILSLKQLSSWLSLLGILFASPVVLSSNFMTPIYDLKFYNSDLCLQYPSLRPLPSGPHLYFSYLIGHHKLSGNRHLKINMSNNKHMIYPVTLLPIKKSTLSLFFPESENVYIPHSVAQCRNKRFTKESFLLFILTFI